MKIKGNLVDILSETIVPAELTIENGKIVRIERTNEHYHSYILPGFVDAHIHIESSLLPPSEFARLAVRQGTVATVSDPHEIANVLGIEGALYMIENGKSVPFKFYFGASPCVPATSFETAGGKLGPMEIRQLLDRKEIKYLSEVMNFPAVIHRDPEMMEKIQLAKERKKRIDGHAPGVFGEDLKKYVTANIETDHECSTLDEAKEKINLGMKILIREGSAARNFNALFPLLKNHPTQCMLCSDDLYPDALLTGHINALVKKAVEKGMDLMQILRCACVNPVQHYGLEVGLLQTGDPADFIIIEDLKNFHVKETYINGQLVYQNETVLFDRPKMDLVNNFNTHLKKPEEFQVQAKQGLLKVIEAIDGELLTNELRVEPKIEQGLVMSDTARDILKIAVVNRYANCKPALGFIKNFGLKKGAIASSVAHDSHNIVCVGVSDEAICRAINGIIEMQGGLVIFDERMLYRLPLPIAGLMSNLEGEETAKRYALLDKKAKELGSTLQAPFMTLSFMALLVIPELKMSDLGLFDGKHFKLTELFADAKNL